MARTERAEPTVADATARYHRLRPAYPDRLFDDLVQLAHLRTGGRVLEIGCGTGQATRSLAERGLVVTCVEVGRALAAIARRELAGFPGVRVVTAPFESWDPGNDRYDAVVAVTSWHWLDPALRFAKVAEVLKPNSVLAIVSTHHVLPRDGDPFFLDLQRAHDAVGEQYLPPPDPDQVVGEQAEIEASGRFRDVATRRYLATHTASVDDELASLERSTGLRSMEPQTRSSLVDAIRQRLEERSAASVTEHYLFTLDVAWRNPG